MRLLFLFTVGCQLNQPILYEICQLDLEPDVRTPDAGTQIVLHGGPFSERYDTVLAVDGAEVPVDDIQRTDCARCDTCRANNDCTTCDVCLNCIDACAACTQELSFTVPLAAAGRIPVAVSNRHGAGVVFIDVTPAVLPTGDTGQASTAQTGSTASTGDTADTVVMPTDPPTTANTGSTAHTGMSPTDAPTGDTGTVTPTDAPTGDTGTVTPTDAPTGDTGTVTPTDAPTGDTGTVNTADTAVQQTGDTGLTTGDTGLTTGDTASQTGGTGLSTGDTG